MRGITLPTTILTSHKIKKWTCQMEIHTDTYIHTHAYTLMLYIYLVLFVILKCFVSLSLYFSFSYIIILYFNGVGNACSHIHMHVCVSKCIYTCICLQFLPFHPCATIHQRIWCIEISNLAWTAYCLARDGYIIYCYGDCNRKFEEALQAQRKTGDGDDLMKAIWLDIYNEQLTTRRKWLIIAHPQTHTYIYTCNYLCAF